MTAVGLGNNVWIVVLETGIRTNHNMSFPLAQFVRVEPPLCLAPMSLYTSMLTKDDKNCKTQVALIKSSRPDVEGL